MGLLKLIKDNPIKSVVLGVGTAAAITYGALAIHLTKSGEQVYRGSINQQRVSYHENASYGPVFGSKNDLNRLEVVKGDTTFVFVDSNGENYIDVQTQRKPVGYEADKLETIIVRNPRIGEKVFSSTDTSDETLYGIHNARVFARGNKVYNALRSIIRQEAREELSRGYSAIESEFGKIDIRNPKSPKKPAAPKEKAATTVSIDKLRRDLNQTLDQFEEEVESVQIIPGAEVK